MADLEAQFKIAAEEVKQLSQSPTDEEKLAVYALFKQATVGDVDTAQPWAVQIEARAKWDAWNSVKGKSKEDAMTEYIAKVQELKQKYG